MVNIAAASRVRAVALRALAGVVAGVVLITAGYRVSRAVSRWALHNGLIELHGDWLLPRGLSWAALGLLVGSLLWLMFRGNAMLPALVAALIVPCIGFIAFLYLGGAEDAFFLFKPYLFETFVVLLTVPSVVYVLGRRNDA